MYAALFLKEMIEKQFEKQVQDTVEAWWIRVDDAQKTMRERAANFMRGVASLTSRALDWVFGPRLLSLRMIPISVYFSLASLFLLAVILLPTMKQPPPNAKEGTAFLLLCYFLFLGLFPALVDDNKWLVGFWWAVFLFKVFSFSGIIFFIVKLKGIRYTTKGLSLVALLFASSLICDLGYIALTRIALKHAREIDNPVKILLVTGANAAALSVPTILPIWVATKLMNVAHFAATMIFFSILFNGIDIVVGLAAFVLAFLLLVHRFLWPVIEQPLYAFQRYSPIKDKKKLFGFGMALLTIGVVMRVDKLWELISKL